MEKIKISAREIADDIKSGLSDSELESKFNLSPDGLQYVLRRLLEAGVITQFELYERTPLTESDVMRAFSPEDHVFKCPVCGKTIPPDADECPNCEEITEKFEKKFLLETLDIVTVGEDVDDQDTETFEHNLFESCRRGDAEEVKRFLDLGADANATLPDGTTSLMIAAEAGNEKILDLLLQFEANVNACDETGATAII
jgi:ankyrin repeat protein